MSTLINRKLKVEPYSISFHPDWEPIMNVVISEYTNRFSQLDTEISPDYSKIFDVFKLGFKNKKIVFINKEAFRSHASGIPFRCSSLDNREEMKNNDLKNFVLKLSKVKKIAYPKNFDILKIPEIMVWNLALCSNPGKSYYYNSFWQNISIEVLQHMSSYIKIFCFFGNIGHDFTSQIDLKTTVLIKTTSLNDYQNCFTKDVNYVFEIIDQFFGLYHYNLIEWKQAFIY
ncbi:uracil DNA glycosylase [Carp edema virus]|nr:uracil DNA glycosylase [Carp edema virus]